MLGTIEASKVVRMPDPFGSSEMEADVSGWLDLFIRLKARLRYVVPEFEDELKAAEELERPAEGGL